MTAPLPGVFDGCVQQLINAYTLAMDLRSGNTALVMTDIRKLRSMLNSAINYVDLTLDEHYRNARVVEIGRDAQTVKMDVT